MLSCAIFICNGVFSSLAVASTLAILPISVDIAASTMTALARPYAMELPIKSIFLRSPKATSPLIASANLSTGTLSPVRADSSALQLAASSMRQSAGTLSPASNKITSPTTRSWLFTKIILPSRSTLQCDSVIDCNAAMACSALLSCTTPNMLLSSTTTAIIITSANDSRSFVGSALLIKVSTRLTIAATSKIIIIGSASCLKNFTITDCFLPSASLFLPFCASLCAACSELSPCSVDCTLSSVCCVVC